MGLVMSLEFTKKQRFKLKKIERPIYMRNINGMFNEERLIEHTVKVSIYYQGHKDRMEIDLIRGQKWNVILGMPQLVYHNPEIDWRIEEFKITRCTEKCEKQWRLKQGKSKWEKQKEEEKKKKGEEIRREKTKNKKQKEKRTIEVTKVAEKWEIWKEKEKIAKSEEEAKKLVLERFHKWIHVFGKKASERMSTRKLWDHAINTKEEFVLRKRRSV